MEKMNGETVSSVKLLRFFACTIMILAFIIVGCWGWSLCSPRSCIAAPAIYVNIHCSDANVQDKIKSNVEAALLSSYREIEQKAIDTYDKNFATLLTVLTIFGIAWPVIIALLQFKFSERELKKIDSSLAEAKESNETSKKSLREAQEANEKSAKSLQKAQEAQQQVALAIEKMEDMQAQTHLFFYQQYTEMSLDLERKDQTENTKWQKNLYIIRAIAHLICSYAFDKRTGSENSRIQLGVIETSLKEIVPVEYDTASSTLKLILQSAFQSCIQYADDLMHKMHSDETEKICEMVIKRATELGYWNN